MEFPPGYDNPVLRAGIDTITRDALWKNPPPLDADCEHEFRRLPVIEFRVTVLCLKCRGLNIPLSQAIVATPSAFEINPDGVIRASARLRRRDPAEAAELIRAGYREHGIPRELAEAMIEETLRGE